MTENIVLIGVLFLGGFVGLLLGLTLQLPKSQSLKTVVAVIGAALGATPVAFMQGLAYEKWMYPVGLVVGLLWMRVISARTVIARMPERSERLAWYIAWVDTAAVIIVTAVVVLSATFIHTQSSAAAVADFGWVARKEMPCRWAWIYLGRFSPAKKQYELPEGFRYADNSRMRNPVPNSGDEIVLTAEHALIISNYASADASHKCDSILEPPWGYRPETAIQFEAGTLRAGMHVLVNQTTLMPSPEAEPTYVWTLVGPK
jgi:hypothetical protein